MEELYEVKAKYERQIGIPWEDLPVRGVYAREVGIQFAKELIELDSEIWEVRLNPLGLPGGTYIPGSKHRLDNRMHRRCSWCGKPTRNFSNRSHVCPRCHAIQKHLEETLNQQ